MELPCLVSEAFASSFPPLFYIHRNSTVKIESQGYLVPTWVKKPEFRFRTGIPKKSKQALGRVRFGRIPIQKTGIPAEFRDSAGIPKKVGETESEPKNGNANQDCHLM